MATTKGGFNINPRLPRTPEPTSNKHGSAKWGTGRGSGRVASRFLKGRSSLSMKDVMSMAAEAAQRADAHMNLPEKKSGSRKSPHSLGRRAGAQRQHSSVQKSGRSSDEESPSEDEDEDEESSSEDDLQREEEHDSGGHEPYRDTQGRAQAPVLTPRGVQQEFASAVQPGGSQTVRVWSEDLGKAEPPELRSCLQDARRRFCKKYYKYVFAQAKAARKVGVQTHPVPIYDCVDEDTLYYMRDHKLGEKWEGTPVEELPASVVHAYVTSALTETGLESIDPAMRKLGELKCHLSAEGGLKAVEDLFKNITRIKREYRVDCTEKEIIRTVQEGVSPASTVKTIQNLWKAGTREAKRSRVSLKAYHKLLNKVAETAHEASLYGITTKTRERKPRKRDERERPKPEERKPQQQQGSYRKRSCFKCGSDRHAVFSCGRRSEEEKSWGMKKWYQYADARKGTAEQRAVQQEQPKTANRANGGTKPEKETKTANQKAGRWKANQKKRGNAKANPKKVKIARQDLLQVDQHGKLTTLRAPAAEAADGTVSIVGVQGHYMCDGGCDRATVMAPFAQAIAATGKVRLRDYKPPFARAELADGSETPIKQYIVVDLELTTRVGPLVLKNTQVDVLPSKSEDKLVLLGKAEEKILKLKPMSEQLEELVQRTRAAVKTKVRFNDPIELTAPVLKTRERFKKRRGTSRRFCRLRDPLPQRQAEGDPNGSLPGLLTASDSEESEDVTDTDGELWTGSESDPEDAANTKPKDTEDTEGPESLTVVNTKDSLWDDENPSRDGEIEEDSGVQARRIAVREHPPVDKPPDLDPDGLVYATEESWQRVRTTRYVANPDVRQTIFSSAAIHGLCDNMVEVTAAALPNSRKDIMGALKVNRLVTIRVLPGSTDDLSKKFIVLREAKVLIIKSEVPLVLMGRDALEELQMRTDENIEMSGSQEAATEDRDEIVRLLKERLDEAKCNGLSEKQVDQLSDLVMGQYLDVFRLRLTPGESASVPPLEVKLQPNSPPPPRPYQRRYSKEETEFFISETAKLEEAGVIRRSKSPHLLPCNLVKKKR